MVIYIKVGFSQVSFMKYEWPFNGLLSSLFMLIALWTLIWNTCPVHYTVYVSQMTAGFYPEAGKMCQKIDLWKVKKKKDIWVMSV